MDTARRGFSEFTISTATNPRCGDGRVFLSARDGQGAKIVAFGSINLDDMRPKAFKAMIRKTGLFDSLRVITPLKLSGLRQGSAARGE